MLNFRILMFRNRLPFEDLCFRNERWDVFLKHSLRAIQKLMLDACKCRGTQNIWQ